MSKRDGVSSVHLIKYATVKKMPVYLSREDKRPVYVDANKDYSAEYGSTVSLFKYEECWYRFEASKDYEFIKLYGDNYKLGKNSKRIILITKFERV